MARTVHQSIRVPMTLPRSSADWPPEALTELLELAYIKAEQRREDTPSTETWRMAEISVRQQWERR
jgi:hypothetical protein